LQGCTFARKLPVPQKKTAPDPWRARLYQAGDQSWMA
jgi:hypothetical protein